MNKVPKSGLIWIFFAPKKFCPPKYKKEIDTDYKSMNSYNYFQRTKLPKFRAGAVLCQSWSRRSQKSKGRSAGNAILWSHWNASEDPDPKRLTFDLDQNRH